MINISAFTKKYDNITKVITTPVYVSKNNIESSEQAIRANAIWDTGAMHCAISKSLAEKLKLVPLGKIPVGTANGIAIQNYYAINLMLPNNFPINNVIVNEIPEIEGANMLIGMSVITQGDFSISNKNGKTVVSFRIPSTQTTDYVALLKSSQPAKTNKIGRNELCPCGSGKKFKNCHGRN